MSIAVAKLSVMEEVEKLCCVRGYHLYKDVWEASSGQRLMCEREPRNPQDCYAVAAKKGGTVVGLLPRKLSRVCLLFLRRRGKLFCSVSGLRRPSPPPCSRAQWLAKGSMHSGDPWDAVARLSLETLVAWSRVNISVVVSFTASPGMVHVGKFCCSNY